MELGSYSNAKMNVPLNYSIKGGDKLLSIRANSRRGDLNVLQLIRSSIKNNNQPRE